MIPLVGTVCLLKKKEKSRDIINLFNPTLPKLNSDYIKTEFFDWNELNNKKKKIEL